MLVARAERGAVRSVGIHATGYALGSWRLDNPGLIKAFRLDQLRDPRSGQPSPATADWIVANTGVEERWYAWPGRDTKMIGNRPADEVAANAGIDLRDVGETTSDMAFRAADNLIARSGIDPRSIGFILLSTSSPDSPMPATATRVQALLDQKYGIGNVPACDINSVCSGTSPFGLALARGLVASRQVERVLFISSGSYSRIQNYDYRTCVVWGDGAGAALFGPVSDDHGWLAWVAATDGAQRNVIQIPAGGAALPSSPETVANAQQCFRMDGRKVYDFAIEVAPAALRAAFEAANISPLEAAMVVIHQANRRMLQPIAEKLGIPVDRFPWTGHRFGNTGDPSVAIALAVENEAGHLKDGDVVALTGFGGGLSWGADVLRWGGVQTG